jgi:pyruvate/2-oxoglutarate dehydrogenase complex dihydrolipoamide dehydrogenase (E3) component
MTTHAPLLPDDAHNRALLAHVHPPDWVNPVPADRYHLVVIGGGTAGLVSAAIASGLGARVALVERHLLGGDCLNVGCVPSKALLRAARAWADARAAHAAFGAPAVQGDGDFARVMTRLRELRAQIAPVDGAPRYRSLGVDVFFGDARFTGPEAVEVDGRTLRFRRAIVATGARAALPSIPGLADASPLTNDTVFSLAERPRRLAIIGAGPIGLELAQAFARFGSEVTVLNADPRALPRDDADAAAIVQRALEADGVRFRHGVCITDVSRTNGCTVLAVTASDGRSAGECEQVEADAVLVAAGRTPNIDGLELDAAGVISTARGITVNDRFRTSNPRVFAIGDVASPFQFTHAADAQARLAVPNALFFGLGGGTASSLVIPWATYTAPEVAHVGQTGEALAASGTPHETIMLPMHDNDRGILEGDTAGFLKVHVAHGSDRILGATLVCEHAGDVIDELVTAMRRGHGLGSLAKTIRPYPTRAAILGRAADQYNRRRLTPRAKGLFAAFFRWVQ